MIFIIIFSFLCLILVLCLVMSFELRQKLQQNIKKIMPMIDKKLKNSFLFIQKVNHAAEENQTQSFWYIQQWWILISSLLLFGSIIVFAVTRPISPIKIEADYLKEVDPQIYTLLNGEMLTPPPEVEESLVNEAIISAMQLEQQNQNSGHLNPIGTIFSENLQDNIDENQSWRFNTNLVDRKWDRLNPRYKQRLLMVFKIMKERYNYEMVLLEGYRSPARQNMLSSNINTTRAKAFQSYHQFGLASDIAFKREGKVVISERDPWAWRGYQLYGEVAESVGLTWGGRWKSIQDYGHTEYRMPGLKKTAEMAEKLSTEGQFSAQN